MDIMYHYGSIINALFNPNCLFLLNNYFIIIYIYHICILKMQISWKLQKKQLNIIKIIKAHIFVIIIILLFFSYYL